jgi:RNA polymerase sigma factor (sigma-70 family)
MPTTTTDERTAIGQIRSGDTAAFAVIYSTHMRAATAFARSLTRCAADADDLVAEGFTRLLSTITAGDTPIDHVRPYLFGIIKNLARTSYRRESRTDVSDEIDQILDAHAVVHDTTGEAVVAGVERATAMSALGSLPEAWRDVLWNVEVLGHRPRHLAFDDTRSAHTISALAHRAREGLRDAYLSQAMTMEARSCHGISDRLGAFVRDHLGRRERTRVAAHIDGCERCRHAVEGITELAGELAHPLAA